MSYLDPQSWDDVDSAGNALDWADREGKLYYPGYEMLRRAAAERSYQNFDGVDDFPAVRAPGKIYPVKWAASNIEPLGFGRQVRELRFLYVDTESIQDWEGETVKPNSYSETILAAIGDSAWANSRISADFSLQCYKVLNKYRWRYVYNGSALFSNISINREYKYATAATWADAVAAFNAASWEPYPITPLQNASAGHWAIKTGGFYEIQRIRITLPFSFEVHPAAKKQFYHYQKIGRVRIGTFPIGVYSNPDMPEVLQDTYHLVNHEPLPTSTFDFNTSIGNYNNVSLAEPATEGTFYGWQTTAGYSSFDIAWFFDGFAFHKFDVDDGFKFVPPPPPPEV